MPAWVLGDSVLEGAWRVTQAVMKVHIMLPVFFSFPLYAGYEDRENYQHTLGEQTSIDLN